MKHFKKGGKDMVKLLDLHEATPEQQLLLEYLPIGDSRKNVLRKDVIGLMKRDDASSRKLVKSLLPFVPVVATRGYFVAKTPEELDTYVAKLQSKIDGLQRTINYLKKHRNKMVYDNGF
jgi:hypothetical protein